MEFGNRAVQTEGRVTRMGAFGDFVRSAGFDLAVETTRSGANIIQGQGLGPLSRYSHLDFSKNVLESEIIFKESNIIDGRSYSRRFPLPLVGGTTSVIMPDSTPERHHVRYYSKRVFCYPHNLPRAICTGLLAIGVVGMLCLKIKSIAQSFSS